MQIISKPVSNYTKGRQGYKPEAIVIHIAEGWLSGAYSWFNNKDSRASAHYMVGKKGEIWRFVAEKNTAWHAGGVASPSWKKLKKNVNPNLYTIGIEHEGFSGQKWTEEMYESSGWLIKKICKSWNISIDRDHIIGHHEINSVSRMRCPGTGVNFAKLINIAKGDYEDPEMIAELEAKIEQLEATQRDLISKISNLELQNAAILAENKKLKGEITYIDTKEINALINQNRKLSEEVYNLQQLRNKLVAQVDELEEKLENGDQDPTVFSTGELASAMFKKIFSRG